MPLKIVAVVLALLVLAESAYISSHQRLIDRFKPMDDDGYVAFDTVTGQLCRTFAVTTLPTRPLVKPQSNHSPQGADSKTIDKILQTIENDPIPGNPEGSARVDLIRGFPACMDIH